MTTLDDILGKGGNKAVPPKGSKEWAEQQGNNPAPAQPAKGTQERSEQNSGGGTPVASPTVPAPAAAHPPTRQSTPPQAPSVEETSGALAKAVAPDVHVNKNPIPETKKLGYAEMYKLLNPYQPPTAEELEKERRKEKRQKLFSAISDGISALSNLYFTTKGAPNAFNPSKSMSATTRARWEKLKADREAKRKEYFEGYMRAKAMDDDAADKEWQKQHTAEREKIEDARYDAAAKLKAEMADLDRQLKNNQITKTEYEAKKAKAEADHADELAEAKVKTEKAKAKANNASAGASNARAGYYRRKDAGGDEEFIAYDKSGKEHRFKTAKAAEQYSKQQGTWQVDKETSTTTVGQGRRKKTTTTTRPIGCHSVNPKPKGNASGGYWASGL